MIHIGRRQSRDIQGPGFRFGNAVQKHVVYNIIFCDTMGGVVSCEIKGVQYKQNETDKRVHKKRSGFGGFGSVGGIVDVYCDAGQRIYGLH